MQHLFCHPHRCQSHRKQSLNLSVTQTSLKLCPPTHNLNQPLSSVNHIYNSLSSIPSCRASPSSVYEHLRRKYDAEFNKFRKRPINLILADITFAPVTLLFKDLHALDDTREHMRAFYPTWRTRRAPSSRQMLREAVRFLPTKALTYEYPTMFVTETEAIFSHRYRQLSKMKPIDLSSDQSSSHHQQFSIQHLMSNPANYSPFLKPGRGDWVSSPSSSGSHSPKSQSQSYDTKSHNIFLPNGSIDHSSVVEISFHITKGIGREMNVREFDDLIIDFEGENSIDLTALSKKNEFNILTATGEEPRLNEQVRPYKHSLYPPTASSQRLSSLGDYYAAGQADLGLVGKGRFKIERSWNSPNSVLPARNRRMTEGSRRIREKAQELLSKIERAASQPYSFENLDY